MSWPVFRAADLPADVWQAGKGPLPVLPRSHVPVPPLVDSWAFKGFLAVLAHPPCVCLVHSDGSQSSLLYQTRLHPHPSLASRACGEPAC